MGNTQWVWCVTVHGIVSQLPKEVGDHPWVGSWYRGILESVGAPPWSSTDCNELSYFGICSTPLWRTTDSKVLRYFGFCSAPLWSTTDGSVVLNSRELHIDL